MRLAIGRQLIFQQRHGLLHFGWRRFRQGATGEPARKQAATKASRYCFTVRIV